MNISKAVPTYEITDTWNDYTITGVLKKTDEGNIFEIQASKNTEVNTFHYNNTNKVVIYVSCDESIRQDFFKYCEELMLIVLDSKIVNE